MRGKRLLQSISLVMIRSSHRRADYLRKHDVLKHMGEHCTFQRRKIPLYPKLISIGDNVHLAAGVSFITHDVTHIMLNHLGGGKRREKVGCIEIGDNVFVGAGTRILYDVRIGSNVIIGTGSIITKDIPDNSVAAGSPARVIGSFDDYLKKRDYEEVYPENLTPRRQEIQEELADWCWERFNKKRKSD